MGTEGGVDEADQGLWSVGLATVGKAVGEEFTGCGKVGNLAFTIRVKT
ncbi:MAG: hypothetical protein JWO71_1398 [Candidatus Acidoferrum typicum]|nr:hypothetical protein [Candidatus Acidoferrum typicum]